MSEVGYVCGVGLLSGCFTLVLNKLNTMDPEPTTPSGLYVYLWTGGVGIKRLCSAVLCPIFVSRGYLAWHIKASFLQIDQSWLAVGRGGVRLIPLCLKFLSTLMEGGQ